MMPALSQVANTFIQQAIAMAAQVKAPSSLANAFFTDPPAQIPGGYYIDVHVDLKVTPAAAAYEWGSGVHATRGQPREYPIPVQDTGVAFPSSRWPNYNPPPGKGIPPYFYFAQVSHPGVAPRPYLAPTLQNHIQEYSNVLMGGLVAEIFVDQTDVIIEVRV